MIETQTSLFPGCFELLMIKYVDKCRLIKKFKLLCCFLKIIMDFVFLVLKGIYINWRDTKNAVRFKGKNILPLRKKHCKILFQNVLNAQIYRGCFYKYYIAGELLYSAFYLT